MDTIIFGLILATGVTAVRSRSRTRLLVLFAISLVAVLVLFRVHATDALDVNF